MDISPDDMENYKNVYDSNRKLIIKKNTLNLLLKGPQSESIRMVLDKVVADGAKEDIQKRTFKIGEDQLQFLRMLRKHNYDINKIIDEHVQRMNTMMVEETNKSRAKREAESEEFREFSRNIPSTLPTSSPSGYRPVDDSDLKHPSSGRTASDFALEKAEAQAKKESEEPPPQEESSDPAKTGPQAQDKSTGQKSTTETPNQPGSIKETAKAAATPTQDQS